MTSSNAKRITLDSGDLALFRDRDFEPHKFKVYLDTERGVLSYVYDSDEDAETDGLSAEDNATQRQEFAARPNRYSEIPVPDHGQVHAWFKDFLDKRGCQHQYFRSIGGWLKEYGEPADH